LSAPFEPTEAPPEIAETVAVPLLLPAKNVATARPFASVSASAGWMAPSDVVKVTCVPLCGGNPEASITCAVIVVEPLTGTTLVAVLRVIVEPLGARSGTFWQAPIDTKRTTATETATAAGRRVIILALTILNP
jgi:hypothetical protein